MLKILLSFISCCLAQVPSSCQGSSGFLLFTDSSQGIIYKANSEGYGLLSSPKVIINSSFTPQAVTYDPKEQRVNWSDTVTRTISRAFLNGSSDLRLIRYVQAVAIAVDSVGRNLYWADNTKGRIEVARLDGTHRKILVRTTRPTDIALDLTRRQIYWSSAGVIERSSMDGTDKQVIVNGIRHDTPIGLCLDTSSRTLFWTLENSPDLFFVSLDNPGGQHYHFQTGLFKPFKMTILDQHIYWTDKRSDSGQITSVDFTTADVQVLTDSVREPRGIWAYSAFATFSKSNCSKNNGGCSHLCLLNPRQDVCACPDKMALKDDGKTCFYNDFLLFIDGWQEIYFKSLMKPSPPKSRIPIGRRGPFSTIDFDPVEQKVYWTNPNGEITRAYLDGSSLEIVVNNSYFWPRGHAVDVIGRNIYILDTINSDLGIIVVCKLDGSNQHLLLSFDGKPQAIALDGKNGVMYWITFGLNGDRRIERAQMDGKRRQVLVRGIKYRNSWGIDSDSHILAFDSTDHRLYWVDQDRRHLSYLKTNVKTRKIHTITVSDKKRQLYGVVLKEDFLYWSDAGWRTGDLYRLNKTAPSTRNVQHIVSGIFLTNFYVYYSEIDGKDNNHPCAQFNGWCTHLCLLKPGGYSCVCPGRKGSRPCYTSPVNPTTSTNTTGSSPS